MDDRDRARARSDHARSKRVRSLSGRHRLATVGLAITLFAAWPAAGTSAQDALPRDPSELLLVGDSVTAGIYFLSLSETSTRQAWAGQVMRRLGFEPDRCRFQQPFPINHLGLTLLGFGIGGLAYPWAAVPALLPQGSRFAAGEERTIVAVPGQVIAEVLEQSSQHKGRNSAGWTFANLLLPRGLSAVQTIEQWKKRPRWVVLFIGANDLLASFGMVADAVPPSPAAFARSYGTLVDRLRAVMAPDAPADHFLVLTLPDVTRLPFLQPLPASARDPRGRRYQDGSMASAFLIPFRDRFQPDEVWTPEALGVIRARVEGYNAAIRDVARSRGLTTVDLTALIEDLRSDASFASANSPYFSPDLHHPSFRTHARIAESVLGAMARVAGTAPPPPLETTETPLPHNGDFSRQERARVDAMVRLGLIGLKAGPLPPKPTFRVSVEAGGQAGHRRAGGGALSLMAAIESSPSPVTARWLSRGNLGVRGSPGVWDAPGRGNARSFPPASLEVRAGVAFEPIGMWNWTRLGGGLLYAGRGGLGWYARGEWRLLYAEASSRDLGPDRVEAGLLLGRVFGRPGRNGD